MSELQSLLLVLGAIYGADCLVWVRLNSVAFITLWSHPWRLRHPSRLAGNARGGFLLSHPLPPLGTVVYGQQFPISLSPEAACSWVAIALTGSWRPHQPVTVLRFDEIHQVATRGKQLFVDGRLFLKTSSEAYAVFLAEILRRLRQLPAARRAEEIKAILAAQLDTDAVARRLAEVQQHAKPIRRLANGLFLSAFLLAPLAIAWIGLRRCWWALLIALLAQTWRITWRFRRAHQALMPAAAEERFTHCLTMLLAVPTAMRAHDLLSRRGLEHFHPLALARVLCAPETFKNFAQSVLRDLHYPIEPAIPMCEPVGAAAVTWFHAAWRELVDGEVRRAGLSVEELLAPPHPAEPHCASYCPRCGAQFIIVAALCAECGGRLAKPFAPAPGTASRAQTLFP